MGDHHDTDHDDAERQRPPVPGERTRRMARGLVKMRARVCLEPEFAEFNRLMIGAAIVVAAELEPPEKIAALLRQAADELEAGEPVPVH